ncbi:MAG: lipopolysaccharide biosynthesis protein [Candidatus Marinimicrobia bacterium]|nr:lipopolysaccharide biosynthesis protein [Candidatus Neomarinimicrobiota bacterium]
MGQSEMKSRAVKGVSWTLVERFGIQSIKFVVGIILARLLSPEEFGIIGIITVFFLVAEVFIDSGFGQAYIQKKEVSEQDANTVFYTNLLISLALYGLIWFAAPLIAGFYEKEILLKLTRVMGLVIVVNAFSIIQVSQLTRAVNFKRKSKISLIAITVSGLLGIGAAWRGMGVWSLVVLNLSERVLITAGLWITSKWIPSLTFSRESFKAMFRFGSWILFGAIVEKIFDNIYVLVIGKFFPFAQLGFYTQAKKMQRLSSQQITASVGIVTFPVFSQVRNDIPRLQNIVKKFLQQTLLFMSLIMTLLFVVAKPFVLIFLTEKWAPMIPYLQILCLAGVIYPINVVNVKVLLALGKSRLNFNLSLIKNSLRILNIILTYRYGISAILMGEVAVAGISVLINAYYTGKYIQYGFFRQMKDIILIFIVMLAAGAAGVLSTLGIVSLWLFLAVGLAVTSAAFLAMHYLFNRNMLLETLSLKNDLFGSSKKP